MSSKKIDASNFLNLSPDEQKKIVKDVYDMVEVDNFSQEEFIANFANSYGRTFDKLLKTTHGYNNPLYANDVLKDVNLSPSRPSQANLKRWLEQSQRFEKELRDASQFLMANITQYYRAINHFATMLSYNYELLPAQKVPKDMKKKITYYNGKRKANDWLRKFRPKEQFITVMMGVMSEGGKYYYVRESDEFVDLQEMPQDYCYITDQTSVGWAYQFDMTFFYRYPDAFTLYAPEFEYWYQEIAEKIAESPHRSIYLPMPVQKSAIFKFEDGNAGIRPPLSGVFKDALEIQDYKDLLKTRIELDTWQVVMQEIPKDSDGKPTIDARLAGTFVALVQAQLPNGVKTAATPLKPSAISFNQSQTQNNIIGTGEQNFWGSIGIAGNQFGENASGSTTLRYSNLSDYNFVRHMYKQFERFVNYQLSMVTGEYNFRVKFFGSSMFEDEEIDRALKLAQNGGNKQRLFASYGYEPFEIEAMLMDEIDSGLNELMVPLQTSYTMSDKGDGGRPQKSEGDLSEAGATTREGGYNEEK